MDNWYFRYQLAGPAVGVVATGGTLTFLPNGIPFVVPNDVLMMMPGSAGMTASPDLIVARFTAPSAGLFDLAGSFTDLQKASVGLTIVVNGVTVFNSSFSGNSPYQGTISFSENGMSLAQGATIDFVVDSLGQQDFDVLGLKALITQTNAAPSLALANTTTSLAEGTYADPVKVANITVTDDGVGTKNLTLSGADKDLFFISIDGTELFLKPGTVLDFEGGNTTLDVTVEVDDPAVDIGIPDDSETLSISVTNVVGNTIVGRNSGQTHTGTGEEDFIFGLGGNDTLQGLGGNDTLDGGSGKDTMIGGTGNDTYVVDNSGDVVTENSGEGIDTVQSSVTYTLSLNMENLTLTGTSKIDGTGNAANNVITGNGANNVLAGLGGADVINGGDGNDTIKGGDGGDTLTGGLGNDTFVLAAVADSIPAAPDIITDFFHGQQDKFDFSAIDANTSSSKAAKGDQAFLFAGQNANVVANSVTWFESSDSGNTIVQADVNGDTTADLTVVLTGINHNLTASNFIL
jgi:Ca2+-binding RTX toxin-like protein